MKLNRAKPNVAEFPSQAQQAEMRLILAGKWPPLTPLPVFKYGIDDYRAEIYFDRTHGEWVCRKTFLPSNEVLELRGGFKEVTMALPHSQADGFTELVTAQQHEKESKNEANRRLHAILDWKKNYENGVLYSALQDYLSETQHDEILDCIRMSLTAWQLQFNPKNIAFVFDALCNAGGRLATLIEVAKRSKAEREPDALAKKGAPTLAAERQVSVQAIDSAQDQRLETRTTPVSLDEIKPDQDSAPIPPSPPADSGVTMSASTAEISLGDVPQSQEAQSTLECVKDFAPEPIDIFVPDLSEGVTSEFVEIVLPTALENSPAEPIRSPSLVQIPSTAEPIAPPATRAYEVVSREISRANHPSFVAGLDENVQYHTAMPGSEPQVRTDEPNSPAERIDDSPSPLYSSGISARRRSGFRVGAAVFLAIGFTIGFTVGLNTPPIPPETEESRSESESAQSPNVRLDDSNARMRPTGPSSSTPGQSDPPIYQASPPTAHKLDSPTPFGRNLTESISGSAFLAKLPSTDSNSSPAIESTPSEASPEPTNSTGLIARNAPLLSRSEFAQSLNAVDQLDAVPSHPALRTVALTTLRPSRPSTVLVTAPAEGSKSLTLTFPEKPVAVSSSFAITSQLSVLVSPEPGPAVAHKPARLQAAELVSYAWPRYPKSRDRHGSSETVKVRATIGRNGEVLDVKRVSGSTSLLPDAIGAIRRWRYEPTLLDETPVKAQVDVTIEFRPSQY